MHDKTNEPYFNANQLCALLEYTKYRQAIKKNVKEEDTALLKDIVKDYKLLYKNVQGNTKFLNEPRNVFINSQK
jgi:prophage antirepressor-like protein